MKMPLLFLLLLSVLSLLVYQVVRPSTCSMNLADSTQETDKRPTYGDIFPKLPKNKSWAVEIRDKDQEILRKVAPWVHKHSDYKVQPAEMPLVIRVPYDFLLWAACGGKEEGCSVAALHVDGDNAMYIDETTSYFDAEHIVVHEYIHRLQYLDHGPNAGCEMVYMEEYEAYRLQFRYRRDRQNFTGFFVGPRLLCK